MPRTPVGIVSLAAYLPATPVDPVRKDGLVAFLKDKTLLPETYIDAVARENLLPGSIETNSDGWEKQPWFQAWLDNLPPKKREDPFQGTRERRRVPLDPVSVRKSLMPHPMLPSDAETLAGALALFDGRIDPGEIDLLIVASQVPDLLLPSNASLVQHKLKLPNAGAYHVDTCCSSFITMLEIAEGLVMAGVKEKVLIIANCSAPVNLLESLRTGLIKEGNVVLIASSGAGENYIAVLERVAPRLVQSVAASREP